MLPWILLDSAALPDGGTLRLKQRGGEFSIMLGDNELMNSRLSGSEEALSSLTCARLAGRDAPKILIGGLGMGFTLRTALACLGPRAKIVVAELVSEVIAWAHGPMAEVFAGSLADPRLTLKQADVAREIAGSGLWDAILLDVDNGPDGLTLKANDGLYRPEGLRRARKALTPRGVLAVWSAADDAAFTQRLKAAGFAVEVAHPRASRNKRGASHTVWLAIA
ncbi:spermidine synthase [Rhodoblastus acidophilus]|uniref:spermidine synthase n=1 Tax=Rhodoblastus acidophilus TaxID=1074 RepID=UPI00222576C7|nr:spermidine synthase [Rhodoblastus acidophilus]MCW2286774.1 spermidine synthase [Rhodoblastus acidophilus]MCW2335612.1 spermidine synthase [Rhodoblastus acidophilus]